MVDYTAEAALRDAASVWLPSYPRRVTRRQRWVYTPEGAVEHLLTVDGLDAGYVSVYAFPDTIHPKDGGIPAIDTVFMDFDLPGNSLYGRPDSPDEVNLVAWYESLAPLLDALGKVVESLREWGVLKHFRFVLSGHKGVHVYADAEQVSRSLGSPQQYANGVEAYVTGLIEKIESAAGIDLSPWLDVSSADLARLTRLPNTTHDTATRLFGEPRYCVAIDPEELIGMTPGDYARLTRSRRPIPESARRAPSAQMTRKLATLIEESSGDKNEQWSLRTTAFEADESMAFSGRLDSLMSRLSATPCMLAYRDRPDAFEHGAESHFMEFAIMQEMALHKTPVDLVVEFFRPIPGFDELYTRLQYQKVVNQQYAASVSAWKLREKAKTFWCPDFCVHCAAAENIT
jgi:hypothetical protein